MAVKKTQMTELDVRRIAREESEKVFSRATKKLSNDIKRVSEGMEANKEILGRLERLLLGEFGTDVNDTLKARATFAFQYAKRNTDLKVIERAIPALDWFEDMNTPDKGCSESKLDILGKIITVWTSGKWLLGIFGIVNLATFIGLLALIINFLKLVKELGI